VTELSTLESSIRDREADLFATLGHPDTQGERLWSLCSWLRENEPVHHSLNGPIVVSRYADAVRVLTEPTVGAPNADQLDKMFQGAVGDRTRSLMVGSLSLSNPPEYTRLRKLTSRGFNQRVVSALRQSTAQTSEAMLRGLAGRLDDGETVDFYSEFCEPLALDVISGLLGVPPEDRPWMAPLVQRMLVLANPATGRHHLAEADELTGKLADYFIDRAARLRREPQDNVFSAWVNESDEDSDRFGEDDLIRMVRVIWLGGFETTAAAIANGVVTMIEHPAEAAGLSAGGEYAKKFIDESVRYDPPVMISANLRIASEPFALEDGTVIPAGSRPTALIASANHDPAVYPDPEKFDPSRSGPQSLGFGRGIHNCVGQVLGRMELEITLPLTHKHLSGVKLAEKPRRRGGLPMRTFSRLALTR
jgi:cytochrome P450 family 114